MKVDYAYRTDEEAYFIEAKFTCSLYAQVIVLYTKQGQEALIKNIPPNIYHIARMTDFIHVINNLYGCPKVLSVPGSYSKV